MVCHSVVAALVAPTARLLPVAAAPFLPPCRRSLLLRSSLPAPSDQHRLPLVALLWLPSAAPLVAPHPLYLFSSSFSPLPTVGAPIQIAQIGVAF